MDWLFEANRDVERRFPWISIPGVASKNKFLTVGSESNFVQSAGLNKINGDSLEAGCLAWKHECRFLAFSNSGT
jgi:hypothetical protein